MHSPPQTVSRHVLRHLLALKRPYGSPEEGSVIPFLLSVLGGQHPTWIDGAGNLHVDARTNHRHRTLFVAHTDTVHRAGGINEFREDAKGIYAAGGQPLGADDAAGIAILVAMIGTIPGYYVFTRGEECGGIGAAHLAKDHPELLKQFDRAIAFDRRGTSDIITYQAGGPCASDEFAWALADKLNAAGLMYCPSDAGVYTDTAEFVGIIPECTNISVGYYFEHSQKEWLDTAHHSALLSAVLGIAWDELPCPGPKPEARNEGDESEPPCWNVWDETIRDAVYACLEGSPKDLLWLIAETVHREDPKSALAHLNPRALTEAEVLAACAEYGDWECVLDHLADEAFVPF